MFAKIGRVIAAAWERFLKAPPCPFHKSGMCMLDCQECFDEQN